MPSLGNSIIVAPAVLKLPAESATDLKSIKSLKFTICPLGVLKSGILS